MVLWINYDIMDEYWMGYCGWFEYDIVEVILWMNIEYEYDIVDVILNIILWMNIEYNIVYELWIWNWYCGWLVNMNIILWMTSEYEYDIEDD